MGALERVKGWERWYVGWLGACLSGGGGLERRREGGG